MRALATWMVLVAGCATTASATDPGGAGGKADDATSGIPTKRRVMTHVPCPDSDGPAKVAFFDADSTVRVSKSGVVTAISPTDVNVLPFAAAEIARLNREGYVIAIVSNQGGVGSGKTAYETAEGALATTVKNLARLGGRVHYFDFAENQDELRKPEIGMAQLLDQQLEKACGVGIDLDRTFMVGDSGYKEGVDGPHPDGRAADDFSNADRFFAANLGVPFHEPTDYFGWRTYEVYNIGHESELVTLLDRIEARALALREMSGDADEVEAAQTEAKRLEAEVAATRSVNEL